MPRKLDAPDVTSLSCSNRAHEARRHVRGQRRGAHHEKARRRADARCHAVRDDGRTYTVGIPQNSAGLNVAVSAGVVRWSKGSSNRMVHPLMSQPRALLRRASQSA